MLSGVEMLRRMPVGRLIAAPDMAAATANSQVHPMAARLEALLATLGARMDVPNGCRVGTIATHINFHGAEATPVLKVSDADR